MWPHWEEEQIKGSSDPQVRLQGPDMRGGVQIEDKRSAYSRGPRQDMDPSITVWAIVSPAMCSGIIRIVNLFPET